jgi:hypothetical protein
LPEFFQQLEPRVVLSVEPVEGVLGFTAVDPPAVEEDAGRQVIPGWATSDGKGSYVVTNVDKFYLFDVRPSVSASGQLSYTPRANSFGTTTFEVSFEDADHVKSAPQTFTITINSVNDAPVVLEAGPQYRGYTRGETARVSAALVSDVDSPISKVAFYRDINLDGIGEPEELLGLGTHVRDGLWGLDVPTAGLPLGVIKILAFATDVEGAESVSKANYGSFDLFGSYDPDEKFKVVQYTDVNGNKVKATLTGPGTLKALFDTEIDENHNASRLVIEDSVAGRSSLSIAVTKGKTSSTDQTTIGSIAIRGGLTSISAGKVNLTSGLMADDFIGAITLNDLVGPRHQDFYVLGRETDKMSLTLGRMENVFISVSGWITSFKAVDWLDTDGRPDSLNTAALGSFSISGRAASKSAPAVSGDMQADVLVNREMPAVCTIAIAGSMDGHIDISHQKISSATIKGSASGELKTHWGLGAVTISGSASKLSVISLGGIGSLTVSGQVVETDIQVAGTIGVMKISGSASKLSVSSTTSIGSSVISGEVLDSSFFSAAIGSVTAGSFVGGSIYADKLSSLTIKGIAAGKGHAAVPGIFSGSLELTGGDYLAKASLLGSASIAGGLNEATWTIAGKTGGITVGSAKGSSLTLGDLASFTSKGEVWETDLAVERSIGSISVVNWVGGVISAEKIGTIVTKGQAASKSAPAVAGDFDVELKITGGSFAGNAALLRSASIQGELRSTWNIDGHAGAITSQTVGESHINVAGNLGSFTVAGVVQKGNLHSYGTIGSISVRAWVDGFIVANKLTSITTKGLAATKTTAAVTGDFLGRLVLIGNGVAARQNTLGSASIAGVLARSMWSIQGNSGPISVGAVYQSAVLVGINPSFSLNSPEHPEPDFARLISKSDFTVPTATLQSFTITGKPAADPNVTPSLVNSLIAAGVFTKVTLKRVDLNPALANRLVAVTKITAYSRQTGPLPSNLVRVVSNTTPGYYDALPGYHLVILA